MDQEHEELLVASALAGLSEAVLHWFPWHRAVGRELQPPWTYMVGMLPIGAAFSAWTMRRRRLTAVDAVGGLWCIAVVSGAAVVLAYVVDALFGRVQEESIRRRGYGLRPGVGSG
jgi:hypothetical protein